MYFEFCSITTLNSKLSRHIYNHMSWSHGGMQYWIENQTPGVKLCLLYDRSLISWASWWLTRKEIGAWTLDKFRRFGYAQAVMWALLTRHKVRRDLSITVHSPETRKIMKRLGYKKLSASYSET